MIFWVFFLVVELEPLGDSLGLLVVFMFHAALKLLFGGALLVAFLFLALCLMPLLPLHNIRLKLFRQLLTPNSRPNVLLDQELFQGDSKWSFVADCDALTVVGALELALAEVAVASSFVEFEETLWVGC